MILIAEDDVVIRNVARIVLEAEGYFILTAGDGEQALFLSRQYPGIIHALLSDINMPNMEGLELRKRILTERSEIRVLLMSGMDAPANNIPFLRKPFSPTVLKQKIRELLADSPDRDAGA